MPRHTYSDTLTDVTWSDIGNALDAVRQLDTDDSIELSVRHDTSGGTLDDGTAYETRTVFTASYEYELGEGQTALNDFAAKLSQVPPLPDDDSSLATAIRQRV